jgi:hypothetical protein
VGDAGDVVSATDGQDRGEAGPGGSGRGVREKGVSEAGHRRGTDTWARAARFEPDLKKIQIQMVQKKFKLFQNFVD